MEERGFPSITEIKSDMRTTPGGRTEWRLNVPEKYSFLDSEEVKQKLVDG